MNVKRTFNVFKHKISDRRLNENINENIKPIYNCTSYMLGLSMDNVILTSLQ